MSRLIDEVGNRYGRLLVLERTGSSRGGKALWRCLCDCGNETKVASDKLRSGHTKSCSCLQQEWFKTIHGKSGTRVYDIYHAMRKRCSSPLDISYPNYGGRGISVCKRWLQSFEAFYADMGEPPSEEYSIDRIDGNQNYTPENCRWATRTTQNRNARSNHVITYKGKTQCLSAWTEEFGFKRSIILSRLKAGWAIERALTTPVRG